MKIDPKHVKEIFLAAAELPDQTAQIAYLDQACGEDSGLRARVDALLRSHDVACSFLSTPAAALTAPDVAEQTINSACQNAMRGPGHKDESEALGFLPPPPRPDSLGRIGYYETLQVIGKGGFGIVLQAFNDILQRVLAIQLMTPQLAATSPTRARFLHEARTLAQVRHENMVQTQEGAEQPLPNLVLEFIPGETLQQRLDRTGPLEIPETLRIGRQIAEGLAAAQATHLIYRDIKPDNVLLDDGKPAVKITNFGQARVACDASMTQSDIIAKLHVKKSEDRFQSVCEVADVLSDCEAHLKANPKRKDFSLIPHRMSNRSGRIWVSEVALLLLLLIALAVTELARVTHLFQAHKQVTTDPIKSGNEPQVATAYAWHGGPADAPKPPIAPFDASRAKQLQEAWAKHLGVPVEYTTSLGTKSMRIPPGEFTMGSTAEEIEALLKEAGEDKHWQDRIKSESLQHKLILTQPIYLGVNDVTQSKYEKLVRMNPSDFSPAGMSKEAVARMETNRLLQGICLDLDTGREFRSFRI